MAESENAGTGKVPRLERIEWAIRQGHFVNAMDKMREWAGNQLVNLTPDEFMKVSIADLQKHGIRF